MSDEPLFSEHPFALSNDKELIAYHIVRVEVWATDLLKEYGLEVRETDTVFTQQVGPGNTHSVRLVHYDLDGVRQAADRAISTVGAEKPALAYEIRKAAGTAFVTRMSLWPQLLESKPTWSYMRMFSMILSALPDPRATLEVKADVGRIGAAGRHKRERASKEHCIRAAREIWEKDQEDPIRIGELCKILAFDLAFRKLDCPTDPPRTIGRWLHRAESRGEITIPDLAKKKGRPPIKK